MLWETAGCSHSKEVVTWGEHMETELPGSSVSISIKACRGAGRFATRISAFFPLPASPARAAVGCREARASRFPAVRQPIWNEARRLAPRLPNFQATWRAAWHADRKPGRPWELLSPSPQIRRALGQLSASKAPWAPRQPVSSQPALNRGVPPGEMSPGTETLLLPLSGILKSLLLSSALGNIFFEVIQMFQKPRFLFFFFLHSLLKRCGLAKVLAHN